MNTDTQPGFPAKEDWRIHTLLALLALAVIVCTMCSCAGIPTNQAILQDVANDVGITIPASPGGGMAAMAVAPQHESASAQKSKAFWGN